ncbi:MAG: hypothetical protein KC731_30275 [Myxococcales bacterium]|nr:hypothetical protein [Myxococcales bacterium]
MSMPCFEDYGPFDADERALVCEVSAAVIAADRPSRTKLLETMQRNIQQLDRLGAVLAEYPSLYGEQALGRRRRNLSSLVESLGKSSPSNFDMFLPTRALLSRTLVAGEMNFYRLLRYVCHEGLTPEARAELEPRVNLALCHCLYTRLAEMVLIDITSDGSLRQALRNRAALSLMQIWEHSAYRVSRFFPLLEATWDARRRVPATLGTLLGTAEIFGLLDAGCDELFVDYLAREDHSEDEAAAFREFLFGTITEDLSALEAKMRSEGTAVVAKDAVADRLHDASSEGDPAVALFEFFLHRHLQAAARRQAALPGPKRTAEEYVMIHYLEHLVDEDRLSLPPD